jgi:hypothetical protein
MELTARSVVHYLLDRGILSEEEVVRGPLAVIEVSRRNRNFRVVGAEGKGWFVKQGRSNQPEFVRGLRRDAECCRIAEREPTARVLSSYLPRLVLEDPRDQVMVTELIPHADSLALIMSREGSIGPELASRIGILLAEIHDGLGEFARLHARSRGFEGERPWIFRFHGFPAHQVAHLHSAHHQMLQILQRYPEFRSLIEDSSARWNADTLIHGDFRWDNFLAVRNGHPGAVAELRLVDWELADLGDRAWDVGGLFQAFLADWLLALHIPPGTAGGMLPKLGESGLERAQGAARAFWRAYADRARIGDEAAFLDRTVRFAAVRALQTVYECADRLPQLPANLIALLQLSLNVLKDPRGATEELLGIGVAA